MTVHIVKLCVGVDGIEDLAAWQRQRARQLGRLFHTTRMVPRRQADVLDGGSIYWVIRGAIQARQRIIGFDEGQKEDGSPCCLLLLDPELVAVRPAPRRAFQGWRYLEPADAPPDLDRDTGTSLAQMPAAMRRELAELGLI